jgi:hypothetical protein
MALAAMFQAILRCQRRAIRPTNPEAINRYVDGSGTLVEGSLGFEADRPKRRSSKPRMSFVALNVTLVIC